MRVYSDDDDTAKPEPMSDQHVVDTVAVIGDGFLLDSMRCRKNNHQFTFVNWEGPRVSKGNKRCPGSRYSLSIQCAGQWPFVAHMHTNIKISKIRSI